MPRCRQPEQKGLNVNDNSTTMIIDDPEAAQPALTDVEQLAQAKGPDRTPFVMLTRDFHWPEQGGTFETKLPLPAIFQRGFRFERFNKILGKRETLLRLVFLARADGPIADVKFAVQVPGEVVMLADDDTDPLRLEVLVSPQGEALMLWQLSRMIPATEVPQTDQPPPTE